MKHWRRSAAMELFWGGAVKLMRSFSGNRQVLAAHPSGFGSAGSRFPNLSYLIVAVHPHGQSDGRSDGNPLNLDRGGTPAQGLVRLVRGARNVCGIAAPILFRPARCTRNSHT